MPPEHTAQTHLNPKPLRKAQMSHLASQATGTQLPFDSCHLLHGLLAQLPSGMNERLHTTPHEKSMACTQQRRLQVLAVDVGAVGQILQVYVSNTETWLLHLSRLAVLEVPDVLQHALLVCQVLDEGLPYIRARRNCICGFVCSYDRKKEPRGSFVVRGSSSLCLIFSVSFVASFIMPVRDTE